MAQISRPFQIALVAFGLLAAVWFFALRGHSSTSGSGSSATPPAASAPASTPSASEKAAAPSSIYHGSAPGVNGLSRAVAKAHEAVATSQTNAKQLEKKSAQASSAATQATAPAAPTTSAARFAAKAAVPSSSAHAKPAPHKPAVPPPTSLALQRSVEAQLQSGKIAVLLFWNKKGADDVVSRSAVQQLKRSREAGKIAVHESPAGAVASYGTITRGVQIYGTPTILIINQRHVATTITGSTDAYSLEQAIDEARKG
jgi:hypothetical protein